MRECLSAYVCVCVCVCVCVHVCVTRINGAINASTYVKYT